MMQGRGAKAPRVQVGAFVDLARAREHFERRGRGPRRRRGRGLAGGVGLERRGAEPRPKLAADVAEARTALPVRDEVDDRAVVALVADAEMNPGAIALPFGDNLVVIGGASQDVAADAALAPATLVAVSRGREVDEVDVALEGPELVIHGCSTPRGAHRPVRRRGCDPRDRIEQNRGLSRERRSCRFPTAQLKGMFSCGARGGGAREPRSRTPGGAPGARWGETPRRGACRAPCHWPPAYGAAPRRGSQRRRASAARRGWRASRPPRRPSCRPLWRPRAGRR